MSGARDPSPRTLVLTADDVMRAAFAKLLQARGHRLEFAAELPAGPHADLRLVIADDRCLPPATPFAAL